MRNCHMVILNHTASYAKSSRLILSNILHFKTGEMLSEKGAIESIMGKGWHTWPFDVSRASFTSLSMLASEQGNPVTPNSLVREQTDGQLSVSHHLQHLPFSIFFIHCWNESYLLYKVISCYFDSVNIKERFSNASGDRTVLTNLSVGNESVSWKLVQIDIFILKRYLLWI